jgi:hypothetical protein
MKKKYDNNNIIIASRAYFLHLGQGLAGNPNEPSPLGISSFFLFFFY